MSKPNNKPCWQCDNPTHYRDDGRYTGFCAEHEAVLERVNPWAWEKLLAVSTPRACIVARQAAIQAAIGVLGEEVKK